MSDDDDTDDQFSSDNLVGESDLITEDISHLHSLDGKSRSIKILGFIGDESVQILVDMGSSQNFIHPRVAEKLSLKLTPIKPFRVFVGNGASLVCAYCSHRTNILMQGHSFEIDLHILPIHGPDVVLDMHWLESLGRVLHDNVELTMEFDRDGKMIELRGDMTTPRWISLHSLVAMLSSTTAAECYEIIHVQDMPSRSDDAAITFLVHTPPAILQVLQKQRSVFGTTMRLPPSRTFDHRIHLLPHAKPINFRPYRYPYFQKNEIEKQVKEMLDQGIIQHSQSPFSSLVLLVRKKDDTFRFYIDYRALNAATIPDHFPIPTTDELFDELGGARFFHKA